VLSLGELADDPQLRARAAVVDIDGVIQPAPAPRFSRTESAIQGPPAAAGQDTDGVLAALGRTPDQIAALRSSGAVH